MKRKLPKLLGLVMLFCLSYSAKALVTTVPSCWIPRDNTWSSLAGNDDGSTGLINLGFNFSLYGSTYTSCYVNNNGNITFNSSTGVFSSTGFPFSTPMVAAFWADVDTRACGLVYYKVFADYMVVMYDQVGWYSNQCSERNNFEIVIASNTSTAIPGGNNVAFYYGDMAWTTGQASSGGPFGGVPATVGINKGDNVAFVQVGRFDQAGTAYDGGGGNNDGVDYLDQQCFTFNVSGSGNQPPSFVGLPVNNTINLVLSCGQSANLNVRAIGPESNQTVTNVVTTTLPCGFSETTTNGGVASSQISIVAMACNVGSYSVTVTSTDNGSPAMTSTATINVNISATDTSAPVPNVSPLPTLNGSCNQSVTATTPTATDNCVGQVNGTTLDATSYSSPGTYTIHWTYDDGHGNISMQNQTVIIGDNTPPTISGCPSNITVNAATNSCGAIVSYTAPTATDNCPSCSVPTSVPASWTLIGNYGGHTYYMNTGYDTWTNHNAAATAAGGHLASITSAGENAYLSAALNNSSAFIGLNDVASEGNFVWTTAEAVTYTNWCSGEPNGGTNENYTLLTSNPGNCWVDVGASTYRTALIEFDCSGVSMLTPVITAGLPSGSFFPVGTTTVTYTSTDAANNSATCTFTVTVNDVTPPVFSGCPSNVTINAAAGSCSATYTYTAPTATDNCATVCNAPTSLPASISLGTYGGHTYFLSTNYASWASHNSYVTGLGGHLVSINSAAENAFVGGGLSGNSAFIGFTDQVTEGTFLWQNGDPVAYTNWCGGEPNNGGPGGNEDHTLITTGAGNCWVDVDGANQRMAVYEFDCTAGPAIVPVLTAGLASGSSFPVGVNTVTYTATDAANNSSTCTFTVTVNDVTPPTISGCPANINVTTTSTSCSSAVVTYVPPTATDNCGTCSAPATVSGYTLIGTYGGHTYFRSNNASTWTNANAAALAAGGHLATIGSAGENSFLTSSTDSWIGFTDEAVDGTFVWSNSEPVTYTNWQPGEPNNYYGDEDYTELYANIGTWNDLGTGDVLTSILEFDCAGTGTTIVRTAGPASGSTFPLGTTTVTYTATDGSNNSSTCSFTVTVSDGAAPVFTNCPSNITVNIDPATCSKRVIYTPPVATDNCATCPTLAFVPSDFMLVGNYGGHTYYINTAYKTWPDHNAYAISLGGHLATITSLGENTYLGVNTPNALFIGASDAAMEGTFVWSNGEPFTYSNFCAGEPNGGVNENYVTLTSNPGNCWNDVSNGTFQQAIYEFDCINNGSTGITFARTSGAGTASGDYFPRGTTTVSYTATDASNNVSTCTFTVTVQDPTNACSNTHARMAQGGGSSTFNVSASPNPFSDGLHLRYESSSFSEADVIVRDVTGRVLETRLGQQSGKDIVLGRSLASGVYIVEVRHGDASQKVRVVKVQ